MKRVILINFAGFLTAFMVLSSIAFAQNTLSSKEKKEGWKLLFDGKTTSNWKGYNRSDVPPDWKVDNGVLSFDPIQDTDTRPKDIVTKGVYKDFELSLEWKISQNGNSGILYNVVESPKYAEPYFTGPEMQILDNEGHPDGKIEKHRAGDLYDLIKSTSEPVKAVGQWNKALIISRNSHYTFYLNGVKINEFQMHTPSWNKLVAASKFKQWPEYGKAKQGKLCLQAHGNQVSFRSIKVRKF